MLRTVDITARKLKHVDVCLQYPVEYETRTTGFESYDLPYEALPESNFEDINTKTSFLGKTLKAPLLIGAMTGGAEKSAVINKHLALAAEELGIGLMLGSQRVMLENADALASFSVRPHAPTSLIIGNLGAAQFKKGYTQDHIIKAIELIQADALAIHTNPLQEALQSSGDMDFSDLVKTLTKIVPDVPYPVILKEVGHGLSAKTALAVKDVGFAALDVAGAGGTSWAKVEEFVNYGKIKHTDLAEWGIPTAKALQSVHQTLPQMPLIASGGIRTGLDIAKALIMGAEVVGLAKPLLEPAIESADAVKEKLQSLIWELKVTMHCAGAKNLHDLKKLELISKA